MKLLAPLFILSLFFLINISNSKGDSYVTIAAEKDTCFYFVDVPADMDMSSTYFDTTIVRNTNCKVHVLRLPSWGTFSTYTMSAEKKILKSVSVRHGETGIIDITNLPPGNYGMYLTACGNGGGFTLQIK